MNTLARNLLFVSLLLGCSVASVRAQDEHQGLQAGWAIYDQGNVNFTSSFSRQNRYMHEAEASWIRLIRRRTGSSFRPKVK